MGIGPMDPRIMDPFPNNKIIKTMKKACVFFIDMRIHGGCIEKYLQ